MNIVMYSPQLHLVGGIESVVKELFRIAKENGHRCSAVCECGKPDWVADDEYLCLPQATKARNETFTRWIENERPDLFVIHHWDTLESLKSLIGVLKNFKVPVLSAMHASFPSALLLDEEVMQWQRFIPLAKQCDGVLTVSAIDAVWWRAMGLRAFHVQNPFIPPKMNVERSLGHRGAMPRNALWVGRTAQPKQPSAALAAFAGVVCTIPDARLTMVGGDLKSWKPFRKLAKKLGIERNVTFLPARNDISDLWAQADFHLLSSVTESFCLVLAEAKAYGIPTVMFDIPFLELVQSGQGLLAAPQGDTHALAGQMIRLMTEEGLCARLGEEAKASLAPFNDDAVWASWERVFEALKTGKGGYEVAPELKTIVPQITFAWDNFCERNLWAVKCSQNWHLLTHTSWKPIAKFTAGLVTWGRKMKTVARSLL